VGFHLNRPKIPRSAGQALETRAPAFHSQHYAIHKRKLGKHDFSESTISWNMRRDAHRRAPRDKHDTPRKYIVGFL